jgi:hypothetical protein
MMRLARFALKAGFAILVVMASARPTGAQSPMKSEICFPVNGPIDDMCTGETVLINAEECLKAHANIDASGGTHLNGVGMITGTAVGLTTGNQYVIHSVAVVNQNTNGNNLGGNATIQSYADLISKGSLPNERATITGHITINADGTITVRDAEITDICHG